MNILLSLKKGNEFSFTEQELLISGEPLIYTPNLNELLCKIYRNSAHNVIDALVLQRIHFEVQRRGIFYGSYYWTKSNPNTWNELLFKFHRASTVDRVLHKMRHYLILIWVESPDNDDTFLYRINYDTLIAATNQPPLQRFTPKDNKKQDYKVLTI